MALSHTDGGIFSRKFLISLIGMILSLIGAIIAALWVPFGPYYSTFVSAILGLAGIYSGSNVANSLVVGKSSTPKKE